MSSFRLPTAEFIGESEAIRRVRELARRVAQSDAKVLLTGESGVGKEIVANFIHRHSARASRPYVPVNCGGLPDSLLESELFGHVKGSFTGAYRDKIGRLQMTDGGTVLLDELGEMSLRMQAALLRFLENGEVHRVGGTAPTRIDTRVIAATNRDLDQLVREGLFREDLLYRIKVVHIVVPSLRHRISDLRPLLDYLMARMGRAIRFSEDALLAMERYHWPGNVRELQNVIEHVSWFGERAEIGPEQLPPAITAVAPPKAAPQPVRPRVVVDSLYEALATGRETFWDSVYEPFLSRDLTRDDIRELVGRGLAAVGGSYRDLLAWFGLPQSDYKRFLNFLAAHGCSVASRPFRSQQAGFVVRRAPSTVVTGTRAANSIAATGANGPHLVPGSRLIS